MSVIKTIDIFAEKLPERCACGGQPKLYKFSCGGYYRFAICCTSCGRQTQPHKTEAEARKEWNG